MPLNTLPTEILYIIAHNLYSERDLSALTRTCRLFYFLLTHSLYSTNIQRHDRMALFWAAEKGQPQTVQRMIDAGADLHKIRDRHRQTPLHYAAFFGQEPVVDLLVKNGAELTSFDWSEMSPLHYAVRQGHAGIVKLLLSQGVSPDLHLPGLWSYTPLHVAAEHGRHAMVRLLLEHGADANLKGTIDSATPLHLALQPCIENGMSMLDPSVFVDYAHKDYKILHYGDFLAQQETALALIEMGAELDAKNAHHESCLMLAIRGGYVVVVQQMLERGVDWSLGANVVSSEDVICLDRMLSLVQPACSSEWTRTCKTNSGIRGA